MKANELMIGDWVIGCSGEPFKIGIIDPDFLYWNEVQPIPLTTEILEKNGWIKDGYFYKAKDGSYIQLGQLFEHATFSCKKDGINREVATSPSKLKYVHQLQHALRFCGIEKEIIL